MTRVATLLAFNFSVSTCFANNFGKSANHLALAVSDFDESKKFCGEVPGLEQCA